MLSNCFAPYPYIKPEDRTRIENKYHKTDEPYDGFNRFAFHGYDYDPTTGMTDDEIRAGLEEISVRMKDEPRAIQKSCMIEYVLDHTRIDVSENDYFVGMYSWGRLMDRYTVDPWFLQIRQEVAAELGNENRDKLAMTGSAWLNLDFDHTVPDWDSLLNLGFPGLLERLRASYRRIEGEGTLTEKQRIFYLAAEREYTAILRFVDRLYQYALTKNFEKAPVVAQSLKNILGGAPQTMLDAMQLIFVYFMVSEYVDHYQVRALGYGLDATLYPFFMRDLESGTFTREELTGFIAYFLMQFSAMANYWGQPFWLAGTNIDGTSKVNELSYLILDVYDKLDIYNPKIQIKVNRNTPPDFIRKALDMIRGGSSSIVFCNEEIIVRSLMRGGATYEEAIDSILKGCYEYALKANALPISFSTFNALKSVSLVFNNGVDPMTGVQIGIETGDVTKFTTFKQFYNACRAQFSHLLKIGMEWIDAMERHIQEVNPPTVYSTTIPKCVETLTEANDSAIQNVTDMWMNGFGTTVDALMAVYELVFETKVTTLAELKDALAHNWEGYEVLRHRALSCKHKYGRGDYLADTYANAWHQFFASHFHGKKNSHGGNTEYELHCARAYLEMGWKTAATPDGRRDGEETSKNGSPTMGMDNQGVTALIQSMTKLDLSLSDSGACLDVMLHPSSVQGEDGLDAFYAVLMTYMNRGGASIHFNVFNPEMLRDAQAHPENYQNLQVRVCGWNVLWNDLSKAEQDAFIIRAENIQ